jgi:hypothetical protein
MKRARGKANKLVKEGNQTRKTCEPMSAFHVRSLQQQKRYQRRPNFLRAVCDQTRDASMWLLPVQATHLLSCVYPSCACQARCKITHALRLGSHVQRCGPQAHHNPVEPTFVG